MSTDPIVTFARLYPDAPEPCAADNSALGTLPTRAYRYCEAVRLASGFGWLLYPPRDMALRWDGRSDVLLQDAETGEWVPLGLKTWAMDPDAEHFENFAPDDLKGRCPPVLTGLPEPGMVQIGLGWTARTAEGWSLLVRGVPNLARAGAFDVFEGIIEADKRIGPLFANIRITRTDAPVLLHRNWPIAMATPLRRHAYQAAQMQRLEIVGTEAVDWDGLRATLDGGMGDYARDVRKRRAGEG